jgi:hypothetical protein
VTFLGAIGAAGTITFDTAPVTAAGDVAITAFALASGALPAGTRAPARPLTAVVIPVPTEAAVVQVDLTSTAPPAISAPPMATLTARVVGPAGTSEPIAGARVHAIPRDALGLGLAMPASAVAAADGTVTVAVAPGGSYDLVIDDPERLRARRWLPAVGPGALGNVTLDTAHRVLGTLRAPGGSIAASATSVEAFCTGCAGIDAQRPSAEIATNLAGDFAIAVRDPGIAAAMQAAAAPAAPTREPVADLRRRHR